MHFTYKQKRNQVQYVQFMQCYCERPLKTYYHKFSERWKNTNAIDIYLTVYIFCFWFYLFVERIGSVRSLFRKLFDFYDQKLFEKQGHFFHFAVIHQSINVNLNYFTNNDVIAACNTFWELVHRFWYVLECILLSNKSFEKKKKFL